MVMRSIVNSFWHLVDRVGIFEMNPNVLILFLSEKQIRSINWIWFWNLMCSIQFEVLLIIIFILINDNTDSDIKYYLPGTTDEWLLLTIRVAINKNLKTVSYWFKIFK